MPVIAASLSPDGPSSGPMTGTLAGIGESVTGYWDELPGIVAALQRQLEQAEGHVVQDLTVGLNWYLTGDFRIGWDYIHSWVDNADGFDADILLMRLQLAF